MCKFYSCVCISCKYQCVIFTNIIGVDLPVQFLSVCNSYPVWLHEQVATPSIETQIVKSPHGLSKTASSQVSPGITEIIKMKEFEAKTTLSAVTTKNDFPCIYSYVLICQHEFMIRVVKFIFLIRLVILRLVIPCR